MARYPQFIGPSYTLQSPIAGIEETINLMPSINTSTGQPWLIGTPGLRVWTVVGSGPIRALFALNGRAFAVSGFEYWELLPNRTAVLRGNVGSDGRPATIHSNGTAGLQNFIVSARKGYIHTLDTNAFIQITDVDFPSQEALSGFFIDGYFGVVILNSTTFKLSNLLDGLTWDGLAVAQRSWASDNIVSAITNHRELWLLGSQTSEVWVDTGASFPLAPLQGVFIEGGAFAPFATAKLDNTIYWMDADERGNAIIRRANGYTPERVSNEAVEFHLNSYGTLQDSIAWTYQQDGHAFYVLYIPSGDTFWVYDVSTNQWHRRADWDTNAMTWIPWKPRTHIFSWGKHLVGDRESGAIYEMRTDLFQNTVPVP